VLVGRDAERARVKGLLADAREGRSAVLVVSGEAGVGKTALLDDAVVCADGMRVVRVVGVESEATMPFGTLFDVCRPFLGSIGDLADRQRQALEGALAMGPTAEGDRFAIGAATLSLLAADARDTPLLLVIDDAQWVDDASAASLAFALRRLDADEIAVLVGLRTGERGGFDVTGFPALELARLNQTDSIALAGARRPVSREQAERIAHASGGNPLAILELVGSETSALDGLVPIPAHIERTFAARVEDLSEETRAALLIAAVDDLGLIDVIGRATPLQTFGPAEDAGLVQIAEGQLEFRHPLVRSAIYQRASPTERRAAHAAFAAALPPEQASRRVWHRAASLVEPDEGVAEALEQVAVEAQARHGAAAAAAAWRRAAELTPDGQTRARRFLAASEAFWEAGAGDTAQHTTEAALAVCQDVVMHADIVRIRERIASQSGGVAAEVSAVLRAEADAVAPFDSLRAAYLLADAVTAFWPASAWDNEPNVELARAARDAAGDCDDPWFDYVLGTELVIRGSSDEAMRLLEAAERAIVGGSIQRHFERECIPAWCAWWRGDMRQACAFQLEAVDGARELGLVGVLAEALADLAGFQIDVGAWDDAEAGAAEAIRLGKDTGQLTSVGIALSRQAEVAARRGDADRFEELNAAAARYAGTAAPIHAFERNSRCLLALGTSHSDVAIASRERTESYSIEQVSPNAFDLIEAYVRAGRSDEARARLDEVATHVHVDEARGAYLRCRALLADIDHFDALLAESIQLFTRSGDVFECARTRLCYGERLRRANRRRDARRELGAALDTFDHLRAAPWADRARRELRASGEHRRAQTPEARDDLTTQERQIATLAAEGRTNREIGALLFLSPRTIETHLGRVFRKLGISDRSALPIPSDPRWRVLTPGSG
jgi:DNA-binding CsgD family transcriptional regulator